MRAAAAGTLTLALALAAGLAPARAEGLPPGFTPTVVGGITTDANFGEMAFSHGDYTRLYVTHMGTGADLSGSSVQVIDTATNTVTATIPLGAAPAAIDLGLNFTAADGPPLLYVALTGTDQVAVIDTATNTVAGHVAVDDAPSDITVVGNGYELYLTHATTNTVSVIDTATLTTTTRIPAGTDPSTLTVGYGDPFQRVYVSNTDSSAPSLAVIDTGTDTVTAEIPVGLSPQRPIASNLAALVLVPAITGAEVNIIDTSTNTVVATIPYDASVDFPKSIAVNPTNTLAYVSGTDEGISIIALTPFTDVPGFNPFYTEINWMNQQQISTGYPDRTYRPHTHVARDAMAAFLYRMAGSPAYTPPAVSPFPDVFTDNMYYKEIAWLAEEGISTGWTEPDGTRTFRPYEPINRDAMAAFLYRLAGSPTHNTWGVSPFPDVPTDSLFFNEISWLASQGISTGWWEPDGNRTFRPVTPINRDAMAAFFYRYSTKVATPAQ